MKKMYVLGIMVAATVTFGFSNPSLTNEKNKVVLQAVAKVIKTPNFIKNRKEKTSVEIQFKINEEGKPVNVLAIGNDKELNENLFNQIKDLRFNSNLIDTNFIHKLILNYEGKKFF